jgi:RHS repeat-associated protein
VLYTNVLAGTNLDVQMFTEYNPFRYRGYYYDVDTGWYYLQSRYYNPEWGRFINADRDVNANGDIIGFNMFAYCGNNPIMKTDFTGESWLKDLFEKIGEFCEETFGAFLSVGKEKSEETYCIFYTIETGAGYSKSFDTEKPVNVYASAGEEWCELDEYSVGVDINKNGYGANVEIGTDTSMGLHLGDFSIDVGSSISGRSYIQLTQKNDNGSYTYQKLSINKAECALVVLAILAPEIIPFLIMEPAT